LGWLPTLVRALRPDPTPVRAGRSLAACDGRDDQDLAAPLIDHHLYEQLACETLVNDMGDVEKVEAVVSGGVVDRQFHPHQKDQLGAWSEGRLLSCWFAPAQVQAHARRTQVLTPR
jgi:acyl-homoserine lactone acylase PvdQ